MSGGKRRHLLRQKVYKRTVTTLMEMGVPKEQAQERARKTVTEKLKRRKP